jgi:hypothetical protein
MDSERNRLYQRQEGKQEHATGTLPACLPKGLADICAYNPTYRSLASDAHTMELARRV